MEEDAVNIDIEEAPAPSDEAVAKVVSLARFQVQLERDVAKKEAELKLLTDALTQVVETDLPEALSEAGLESFNLAGGWKVGVDEKIFTAISKEHKEEAHAFVEKTGHGSIIKHEVIVTFDKGEESWAKKFLRDMAQRKRPLKVERKDTIHSSTLKAFVTQQLAIIPRELFGVHIKKVAYVKPPKDKESI